MLIDKAGTEGPGEAEECSVVLLQEDCCDGQGSKQIKNKPSVALTLYLPQIQAAKHLRHSDGKDQRNDEGKAAAPSPDACRHGPDRQQQDPDHAQYQWKD